MYTTHTPVQHCPKQCAYRKPNKLKKHKSIVSMFCEKFRHPLTRDKSYKKVGPNVKPQWCNESNYNLRRPDVKALKGKE